MDKTRSEEYRRRIHRVQDYIESHLADGLTLETLADVAGFSKYHFNRLFHGLTGEPLFQFIQRLRVERAASLLLCHPHRTVTDIAMDCGFSSSALFARVFRQYFHTTATAWRKSGGRQEQIESRPPGGPATDRTAGRPASGIQIESHPPGGPGLSDEPFPMTVTIHDIPDIPVIYIRYVGEFQGNQNLFENLFGRLYRWAGARDLYQPGVSRVFCLVHDNPALTETSKLRISCCMTAPEHTTTDGEIGTTRISGGRYAQAKCRLQVHQYGRAWASLFRDWLPTSGYQPDDRPAFEEYPDEEHLGGSGDTKAGSAAGGRAAGHPAPQLVYLWLPVRPL